MSDWQKRGISTSGAFFARQFRFEARFNSLSEQTSLDAFMTLHIMDAVNPTSRFEAVSLLGSEFGRFRRFEAFSSIDTNSNSGPAFPYADNTFYRLVIEGSRTQNIRAALLDDSGHELIGHTFPHNTSEFSSGFKVGLSQTVAAPGRDIPLDVAVDFVRLTTTDTVTASIKVASVQVCWESLPNRSYQVQYRSELTTNMWTDFGAVVQGNGTTNCVSDTVGDPTRFYRVVTVP